MSSSRHQAVGVGDVVGRHLLRADPRQIAGVAAVVAANDEHQVDRLLGQQLDDRVLPILGRAANGVERSEPGGKLRPRRSGLGIASRNMSPTATDSVLSIVVWLAQPTRCRDARPDRTRVRWRCQTVRERRRVTPDCRGRRRCSRRPRRLRPCRGRPGNDRPATWSACDAVARVSSCQYLP